MHALGSDVSAWWRLFARVLVYYLSLIVGLVVVLYLFPGIEPFVPVGGLNEFKAGTFEEVVTTFHEEVSSENLFRGVYRLLEAVVMSISVVFTIATMVPIAWVYLAMGGSGGRKNKADGTVLETLYVLPVIITAVVLIIQNSIALAFGLAGIVAGVQYRNRLGRSIDAAFLFLAIAVGIASGIEASGIGLVVAMWFCLILIAVQIYKLRRNGPNITTEGETGNG